LRLIGRKSCSRVVIGNASQLVNQIGRIGEQGPAQELVASAMVVGDLARPVELLFIDLNGGSGVGDYASLIMGNRWTRRINLSAVFFWLAFLTYFAATAGPKPKMAHSSYSVAPFSAYQVALPFRNE
jgi:hypothetical protein